MLDVFFSLPLGMGTTSVVSSLVSLGEWGLQYLFLSACCTLHTQLLSTTNARRLNAVQIFKHVLVTIYCCIRQKQDLSTSPAEVHFL